jgi:hypothetical protein
MNAPTEAQMSGEDSIGFKFQRIWKSSTIDISSSEGEHYLVTFPHRHSTGLTVFSDCSEERQDWRMQAETLVHNLRDQLGHVGDSLLKVRILRQLQR